MANQPVVPSLKAAYTKHLVRRQSIQLCKELIALVVDIQKHRGCTLAILSGDHFFETQLFSIQRDVTEKLSRVEQLRREFLPLSDAMSVVGEWVGIRRQWSKDTAEQNFLLHSHLIATLLKYIRVISQQFQIDDLGPEHQNLTTFCFTEAIEMLELSAQARGLSTYCHVTKEPSEEFVSRLKFLHAQMTDSSDSLVKSFDSFGSGTSSKMSLAADNVAYHASFEAFSTAIKRTIDRSSEDLCADSLYTLGSNVISAMQAILWVALKELEVAMSPALVKWVEHGAENEDQMDEVELPKMASA